MIAVTYKTKAALKEAAKAHETLRYIETSMFGPELKPNKEVPFVGPSPYKRVYYGNVIVDNNYRILKVK